MSVGHKLGRGLGHIGAFVVDASIRGATGAGRFGEDLVAGAQEGYTESAAERKVRREAAMAAMQAKRLEAIAAHKAAMAAKAEPEPVALPEPVASAPVMTKRGRVSLT